MDGGSSGTRAVSGIIWTSQHSHHAIYAVCVTIIGHFLGQKSGVAVFSPQLYSMLNNK